MRFLFLYIVPIFSLKLCIHCKHFIKNDKSEYGKCELFTKMNMDTFVVNGEKHDNIDYYYCSTARQFDTMCGEKGKYYKIT